MTNLTSARTLEPMEHQVTVGGQINLNSSVVTENIAAYRRIREEIENTPEDGEISEETYRQLLDAATATVLFRPSPTMEVGYRLGLTEKPLEGLDAGLRYNGQTLKGDAKLQFWEAEDGVGAGAVQLGVGHQFSAGPSAAKLTLQEWSRTDLDVLVPFGASFEEYGRIWGGPRFVWSAISASPAFDDEVRERVPQEFRDRADSWFNDEQITYAGLNLGGAVGYEYLFFALELNVMYAHFRPEILDRRRNLSGLTIIPTGGLIARF